jgi:uncharacterized protein with HEPN domain
MRQDDVTLLDIEKAARHIQAFLDNMTKDHFFNDLKTQSAVLYQLLVVGEAVKRLSSELRIQRPDIPWSLIAGMRDHLIHAYDTVDWEEVWKTATRDIPDLVIKLKLLFPQRPTEQ